MRIFPVDGMDNMLQKLGIQDGESITHPWVTKAIENAQGKVEARNFDIRKNILKYDDVMNDQRKVIFEQRLELMDDDNVTDTISDMRHDLVADLVDKACPERTYPEQWNTEQLKAAAQTYLNVDAPVDEWAAEEGIDQEAMIERLSDLADQVIASKTARFSPDIMRQIEKSILLQSIDGLWREHLITLDHLSKVIGWRGMAQVDPLNEYKREAYDLFQGLMGSLRELVTTQLAHVEVQFQEPEPPSLPEMHEVRIDADTGENVAETDMQGTLPGPHFAAGPFADGVNDDADSDTSLRPLDPAVLRNVRRNDPCPCGSGKKFKHCHGAY